MATIDGSEKRACLLLQGCQVLFWSLAMCCAAFAQAESYRHFPGVTIDTRVSRIQERVENLYDRQDYAIALLNYRDHLAPIGDKYAQYMVGYMYLTGRGADVNPPLALAWYQLAAERHERPYVEARDALAATLDEQQLKDAEEYFTGLALSFGDRRLLLTLMQDDLDLLQRIDSMQSGDHLVSGFLGGASVDYRGLALERLRQRETYLDQLPTLPGLEDIEGGVRSAIAALPDD